MKPIQEGIVWSLHELGAKICVVGDDDQTIYQWRGSDVQNILTFETRYPAVEQIPLEENFRSSDGIVETARAFIAPIAHELEWTLFCTTRPRLDGVAKSSPSGSQLIMTATIHYYVTCVSGRIAAIVRSLDMPPWTNAAFSPAVRAKVDIPGRGDVAPGGCADACPG